MTGESPLGRTLFTLFIYLDLVIVLMEVNKYSQMALELNYSETAMVENNKSSRPTSV